MIRGNTQRAAGVAILTSIMAPGYPGFCSTVMHCAMKAAIDGRWMFRVAYVCCVAKYESGEETAFRVEGEGGDDDENGWDLGIEMNDSVAVGSSAYVAPVQGDFLGRSQCRRN